MARNVSPNGLMLVRLQEDTFDLLPGFRDGGFSRHDRPILHFGLQDDTLIR